MIREREYRYLSPTTYVDKVTKVVIALKNVALTNNPALELTPLSRADRSAEEEPDMAIPEAVLDALDLPADADEEAVLDAIAAMKAKADDEADAPKGGSALGRPGGSRDGSPLGPQQGARRSHDAAP